MDFTSAFDSPLHEIMLRKIIGVTNDPKYKYLIAFLFNQYNFIINGDLGME